MGTPKHASESKGYRLGIIFGTVASWLFIARGSWEEAGFLACMGTGLLALFVRRYAWVAIKSFVLTFLVIAGCILVWHYVSWVFGFILAFIALAMRVHHTELRSS